MIEIKPNIRLELRCPLCRCTDITIHRIVFPGIRVLAYSSCFCCESFFFADVPVGHALYYPKYLDEKTGEVFPQEKKLNWFSRQLKESYTNRSDQQLQI